MRDAKTAEDNYLLYLNKREQAHISDAFDKNRILNVSIAQPATIAFKPTNPRFANFAVGLAFGLRWEYRSGACTRAAKSNSAATRTDRAVFRCTNTCASSDEDVKSRNCIPA